MAVSQKLTHIALVVKDYDEAIRFYTEKLGFALLEDTQLSETKRWVLVTPPGSQCSLLLAKAVTTTQTNAIGNQTGGRVFLFFIYRRLRTRLQKISQQRCTICS